MTSSEFHKFLTHSSRLAFDFAKNYVLDVLPGNFRYTAKLNISYDDPGLSKFDIYPHDNSKVIELITAAEVVDLLCRNNKVPVWIDLSVESSSEEYTLFQLLCAGRYSGDENELYYQKTGNRSVRN